MIETECQNPVYYNKLGLSYTETRISLLPPSGQNVVSAVLPSVLFGFVKSEVWRILVNSY